MRRRALILGVVVMLFAVTFTAYQAKTIPTAHAAGCNSRPTCDGYDPIATGCNVGAYAPGGDPWYITVYWSPSCNANYVYIQTPTNLDCNGKACNAIAQIEYVRHTSSPVHCGSSNFWTCFDDAVSYGTWCSPGYPVSAGYCNNQSLAQLHYCAPSMSVNGPCNFSFPCYAPYSSCSQGWIGTPTQTWKTFETDLFYAPVDQVAACVFYANTSNPNVYSREYCSIWH